MQDGPIVHVVQHMRPGGLEVMALELARAQSARHDVRVVSLEGSAEEAVSAWPRLAAQREQLIFLGKRPGLDAGLPARLYRLFRTLRPTGVHTHHIGPLLYAGGAARAAGVPHRVHTEHDAWHLQDAKRRRVARLALAAAHPVLVADAPHVAMAVHDALGCPAPRVILNGIDTARFAPGDRTAARACLGLPAQGAIIGVAARLEAVKGVDIAIRALGAMESKALLAISGTGTQRDDLQSLAASLGIAERVRFLGHVDDMPNFYRAVDVLCLSSRAEGLPLSLLEAQSCNTPVVAAAVGGVPAAVAPGGGRLVEAGYPAAFAAALDAALQTATEAANTPRDFVLRTASLQTASDAYLALCA